jgi:hypothetical protein
MRFIRVRITLQRMMGLVVGLAIFFHSSRTGYFVYAVTGRHLHTSVVVDPSGCPGSAMFWAESSFWPHFWRALIGKPWRNQRLCTKLAGKIPPGQHLLEMCELENPEIVERPNHTTVRWSGSPSQVALERQLFTSYQESVEAESASSHSETRSGTPHFE